MSACETVGARVGVRMGGRLSSLLLQGLQGRCPERLTTGKTRCWEPGSRPQLTQKRHHPQTDLYLPRELEAIQRVSGASHLDPPKPTACGLPESSPPPQPQ